MATLTVTHDPAALADLIGILTGNGAKDVDATTAGTTVAMFDGEPEARMVAATLAHAATVTRLEISE